MHDTVVIGGGIAGLYYSRRYTQCHPGSNVIVLEGSQRLGGRACNVMFRGQSVVCGAGIGRKKKDAKLQALLQELNVPYREFTVKHSYSPKLEPHVNVIKTLKTLRKAYVAKKTIVSQDFKHFASTVLGKEEYEAFKIATGYTDYEKQDAHDALYLYGMEDVAAKWQGLWIPWEELVKALAQGVQVRTAHKVVKITRQQDDTFAVECSNGATFLTKQVVLATTVDTIQQLLPRHKKLYDNIQGQPFVRVYAQFDTPSAHTIESIVPTRTVVPGPLQDIIPIAPSNGIYMIGYADNKAAVRLHTLYNTTDRLDTFARLTEKALGIKSNTLKIEHLQMFYHPIGTHYCLPLKSPYKTRRAYLNDAQRPEPGIFVVGEVVALNQGWVEGALKTVDNVLNSKEKRSM
jgi:hypothetical protein